jgi:hypothetical protein
VQKFLLGILDLERFYFEIPLLSFTLRILRLLLQKKPDAGSGAAN